MRAATAREALRRHPRHLVLLALTTGLVLGPLSPLATVVAATLAAAIAVIPPSARPAPDDARAADSEVDAPRGGFGDARTGGDVLHGAVGGPAGVRLGVSLAAAAAVLVGAVVADVRIDAIEGGPLARMHGRAMESPAVLLEPVRERARGPAVARARLPGLGVAVLRMRAERHPGSWPEVGDIVQVAGEVTPLGPFDAYQRRRGATAAVDVAELQSTGERRGGLLGVVDGARRRAEAGLSGHLPRSDAALLRGMVLGQDEELTEDVRDDFKRSGLAHVLAVSGQNVMLLGVLVLAAGAITGLGLRARLLIALALVAFYVPLTGAGPSIQRAGVMGAAGLVAALAGRPAHRWYALGLAAAVTLALNPRAAGEPGWQLSFAAVVALLALVRPLRKALARHMPGPVADVAAITTAATLGTAPLMALHFGQVSLAALPANLLAAAAIAPVMWLGMLAATAAQVDPVMATPFNAANGPLLSFVQWVAHTMASAPAAAIPARLGSPLALLAAYGVLAAAILGIRAAWRRAMQRIGVWPPIPTCQSRTRRIAALTAVVAVGLAVFASAAGTGTLDPPVRGELIVSFLNVGQGDATLLRRDGVAVLVDTGPAGGPILDRLAEARVRRLDALVITHAQNDHEGAALSILRHIPTRLVVNGGAGWPTAVQRGLPRSRARTLAAHAGQRLTFGGITMRLLWPPPPSPTFRAEGDPNNRAIVALVESGDFALLLPADAESDVTATLPFPDVDALKVAHHGSDDEGLPALIERTRPEFAAIEVGADNTYGHPTASTLDALKTVDHVYRTDRDGSVHLRLAHGRVTVERSP
ncbi:MAG TPA: ComEC/Rec2 family competence protein [Solirubrobacteraceae bacterium]|nr:ComEC/Rec2 family competence protein [Solirubrobacteraceae bacterium]